MDGLSSRFMATVRNSGMHDGPLVHGYKLRRGHRSLGHAEVTGHVGLQCSKEGEGVNSPQAPGEAPPTESLPEDPDCDATH